MRDNLLDLGGLPPSSPGLKSQLLRDFFSLLLSLWTVLRLNPSSAKQWILQMQLVVTSRDKYYKTFQVTAPLVPTISSLPILIPGWWYHGASMVGVFNRPFDFKYELEAKIGIGT